jgi:hypothetical protein
MEECKTNLLKFPNTLLFPHLPLLMLQRQRQKPTPSGGLGISISPGLFLDKLKCRFLSYTQFRATKTNALRPGAI